MTAALHSSFVEFQDIQTYSGYGNCDQVAIYEPASEDELRDLLRALRANSTYFCFRGSNLSFDDQAIGAKHCIDNSRFKRFDLDEDRLRLTVGSGMKVGEMTRRLLERGLLQPIVPTTSHATVGGCVSCDTYCRLTPGMGRESAWVESFRLMTVDGEVHTCSRDSNRELFYAVIGGLGLIGFILDVEYRLIRVGDTPKYRSHGMVFDGIDGIEHLFLDSKLGTAPEPEQWHGSSAIFYGRGSKRFSIINRHCFEDTDKTEPCMLHAHSKSRLAADLLLRFVPWLAPTLWDMYRHLARRSTYNTRRYWDDPYEALFFMETNYDGKKLVNTLGLDFYILQQSFTLPCTGDRTDDLRRARSFAQTAMDLLDEHRITPAMIDLGLMPVSEAFLLSVSDGADTFVMSIAVEGFGIPEENVVRDIFTELSEVCYGEYGGKIHLTKNMHCRDTLIDEMYGEKLREFRRIKHKYDPNGLLISDMGRKLLGLPRSMPQSLAS